MKYQYKMTQYNTLNVKSFNPLINNLKSGIKNGAEVTLKLSTNVAGDLMITIIFWISCY